MKITILGAGALGCYFGARLQAGGQEVTFVARGAQLDALRSTGLRLESPTGDLHLDKVAAVADLAEAGPCDVLLVTVKNYDLADLAAHLAAQIGPETAVITVQNGVSAPRVLAERIGADRVLPGTVYMPADVKAPGVIRVTAELQGLIFGAFSGPPDARARRIAETMAATGAPVSLSDDIWTRLWEKFIFLSAFAAITALTRLDIGLVRDTPATRALTEQLIDEAIAVARAAHPAVPDTLAASVRSLMFERLPPTSHASLLDDLLRGKRLELDWLSGEVIRQGRHFGIPTPAHGFAYAALAPFIAGPPARG